jgi:hypothetical protein
MSPIAVVFLFLFMIGMAISAFLRESPRAWWALWGSVLILGIIVFLGVGGYLAVDVPVHRVG